MYWRPEEDGLLIRLVPKCVNTAEIARKMGRSADAVRNAARRLNIDLPKTNGNEWTEKDTEILRRVVKEGGNIADARNAIGRSDSTIRNWCGKLGLRLEHIKPKSTDNSGWCEEDVKFIRKMAEDGYSSRHVAERFGVSRNVVLGIAWRNHFSFGNATPARGSPNFRNTAPTDNSILKTCQYIKGHHSNPKCGKPVVRGKSWCDEHCKVVFRQPKEEEVV